MFQSTRAAPDVVENRPPTAWRAPATQSPGTPCAAGLWARVAAQLTRMLAQLALR